MRRFSLVVIAAPNAPDIPAGTYTKSCGGCAVEDGVLTCTCDAPGKSPMITSVAVAGCPSFANSNGQLACDKPGNDDGIPPGPYSNSCGGCRLSDDAVRLECSHCMTNDMQYMASSIDLTLCPSFTNDNGQLKCEEIQKSEL
ncbi:hypothetical protein Pelo_10149 [Pelomyxa schiedti]|nr:hypothetical protein Pelo_10149 [Pelomyxa schiedti]